MKGGRGAGGTNESGYPAGSVEIEVEAGGQVIAVALGLDGDVQLFAAGPDGVEFLEAKTNGVNQAVATGATGAG